MPKYSEVQLIHINLICNKCINWILIQRKTNFRKTQELLLTNSGTYSCYEQFLFKKNDASRKGTTAFKSKINSCKIYFLYDDDWVY